MFMLHLLVGRVCPLPSAPIDLTTSSFIILADTVALVTTSANSKAGANINIRDFRISLMLLSVSVAIVFLILLGFTSVF
jgi:hypothetical protein